MGRPRKAGELKLITGNPGKRAVPKSIKAGVASSSTRAPRHLSSAASAVWRAVLPQLVASKTIADIDLGILAVYCEAAATVAESTDAINREGAVINSPHGQIASPHVRVRSDASARMMRAASVLGIGQKNRQGLTEIAGSDAADEEEHFFVRSG